MTLFKTLSIEDFEVFVCVCAGFFVGCSGQEVRSDMSYLCGCL